VEVLVGTQALEPRRYLVTVSEHLERLGHEVRVFSAEPRPSTDELRVVGVERDLPLAPHLIYSQDAEGALLLADLYPLTPQVFAAHGDGRDLWLPPQLAGIVARVVAFDSRTVERIGAASLPHEVTRLRRPVDVERFAPRGELPGRPRRAELRLDGVSSYLRGVVERACADAGIQAGPDADVVIGRGRDVLEAMSSGLAAYVCGEEGGDGWVTAERYESLEADGFSGRAEPGATNFEGVRRDLDEYDPAMGPANRELALAHDARDHARELVAVFHAVKPRPEPVNAPLRELARLVRVEAASGRRAEAADADARAARVRVEELERELAEARERNRELDARAAGLQSALESAQTEPVQQRTQGRRGRLGRQGKHPSTEG
jgi:hypothetical protein